ncbi:MAG: flagellin/flagellar hook associated protein [Paenibacillus sp.]|nr:flagellin/flagellar hook associated protein [Paenibacillus sp.]
MRINHNLAALNTHRQMTNNTAGTNKSLEKLSSGYRINRAGDDAAGLAISEKMRGQIRVQATMLPAWQFPRKCAARSVVWIKLPVMLKMPSP